MKTLGDMIATIIVAVFIAGGGTYFYFSQKMAQQKKELADQVEDIQSKMQALTQSTNLAVEDLKKPAAEAGAQTTDDSAASAQTTPTDNTPAATPASVDTTNWKSFSSTGYSYTIKYPTDWIYKDNTGGTAMNSVGFRPRTATDAIFNVVIEKSNLDYSIGLIKKQLATNYTFKSQSTADINGKTFTTLNFEGKTATGSKPVVYLFENTTDGLVYHFTANDNADATINANTAEMAKSFTLTASEAKTTE